MRIEPSPPVLLNTQPIHISPDLSLLMSRLSIDQLSAMSKALAEIDECVRVVEKAGRSMLHEVCGEVDELQQHEHYPEGDVVDWDSSSQYYYHYHRNDVVEYGHFHTYFKSPVERLGVQPLVESKEHATDEFGSQFAHLIALSMDASGSPVQAFTANRWVTEEAYYSSDDLIRMLDFFVIDHSSPSWPLNRWLSALFILFRPQFEIAIREREKLIDCLCAEYPKNELLEMEELEITSVVDLDVEGQRQALLNEITIRIGRCQLN